MRGSQPFAANRTNGGQPFASARARSGRSFVSNRMIIVLGIFLMCGIVFFGRLFYLQVIMADDYSAMAEETRTITFQTNARRGTIYDRNGIVLATSVEATTIYANPREVTNARMEAASLSTILGGSMQEYEELLSKTDTTFVYIKRQADVELAQQVKDLALDGIYFIADMRREYPNGQVGGQVIGFCNVDGEGITGLELQYNDLLKGTPGTYEAEQGQKGTPIPDGVKLETAAVDGKDIMVSLDIKLQASVEQCLEAGLEPLGAKGGSSVVMDASTGEIYAICSLPYMDPSHMEDAQATSDQVKAITQAIEPGSVFKTITATAIVENGALSPDDELFVPASLQADEYTITDSHDRADENMSFRRILAESSNIGISLAMERIGVGQFYKSLLKYQINERTGVDYPGEATPTLYDVSTWAKVTGYNISFGQGVAVTPLQIARFYGALENDGVATTPHFLIGLPQTGAAPTYDEKRIIDDEQSVDTIVGMLRSVVTDGTGRAADIDGFNVVGKTSTAEISENGVYRQGVYNLAFTGFLANSSSDLVCFVGASEVGAELQVTQIFHDIMSDAISRYNITPQ